MRFAKCNLVVLNKPQHTIGRGLRQHALKMIEAGSAYSQPGLQVCLGGLIWSELDAQYHPSFLAAEDDFVFPFKQFDVFFIAVQPMSNEKFKVTGNYQKLS